MKTRNAMRRFFASLAIGAAGLGIAATDANACSPGSSVYQELPLAVARKGYILDGVIVQAYNARKRLPEIIRATKIYIGDGKPRDFIIDRDKSDFDARSGKGRSFLTSCDRGVFDKVGQKVERLVLRPSGRGKPRWSFGPFDSIALAASARDPLLSEATRLGRLQRLPPGWTFNTPSRPLTPRQSGNARRH